MRIGLDIGGTKTDAVVLDARNVVRARLRTRTGTGPAEVLASSEHAVRGVVAAGGFALTDIESVGIGIPGMVDPQAGRVRHAVNLGVDDLALAPALAERLGEGAGIPVGIENDVKAASLGAYHLLGLQGSAALLNLGTGMAAGIVVDGRLWRGATGGAGEIGHIPVDPNGAICSCGQRGCLETMGSGSGLARMWPSDAALPARDLFDAADAGDTTAQAVRHTVAVAVASAVRVLVLTVDVQTVVIGGGLSNLGDRLLNLVVEALQGWGDDSPFLASLRLADRVMMLPADLSAAAVGAALVGAGAAGAAATAGSVARTVTDVRAANSVQPVG